MTDLARLLSSPQIADASKIDAQIALANDLALICHRRLGSEAAERGTAPEPTGAARLARNRLVLILREIEALGQARALDSLPCELARDSLADVFGALVEWAATADALTLAELSALLVHRRRFGHPWAESEHQS